MSSQNDSDVFSVRIVSVDYYMSPPIPDMDSCYNSFLGRNVEEVPVIRIFGATPAGQKTCLHVHQALPYFYVPFPEDLLQSPDKGHTLIHTLFSATEKALSSKPTSERQHVHDCSLVRAKNFYGYHSSEEVFVKIILYYPHEILRAASLLLDGSILGKSFQPFEAHIPYLLQFLVDYNLYGMSHLHASKVKFRSPLAYSYNTAALGQKNYDILATPSSYNCKKAKIWDSCTLSSDLLWPDSTFSLDSTENKYIHLTRRQSICQLEADASVEDIINEKFKNYTSFSQTRGNVRMVQSLVPIWEEEYERSGVQEASKQDDPSKPHPDKVLRSFMHGLDYDKALSELCVGTCKYYPSSIHVIDGDEKLATYIKSFSDISTKVELLGLQEHSNIFGVHLVGEIEDNRSKEISSQSLMNADLKSLDAEALGLLNWLASSQAEEELDASDELLQEAILTPLLPGRPYSVALEIAHRDYENASQLECQDILDSVENMLKPERSKEHASSSVQDPILDSVEGVLKSEGSKEQASSFSRDFLDEVSSVIVIPQVDGSFDEILDAQKGNTSESSMPFGRKKTSAQPGLTDAKVSYKPKENKLRGTLPFCISESKQETIETSSPIFSGDEMMPNCLKNEIDLENFSVKHNKTVGLCSVRDLMRKKRYLRVEQAEAQVQKNEYMVPNMKEELTPATSVTHQNVDGDVACSTISSSGFQRTKCLEHQSIVCEIFGVKSGSSANEVSSSKYLMNQEARVVPMHEPESKKLFELSEVKPTKSVCRDERPVTLPSIVKCHSNNHNHNSAENDSLKSHLHKDWNSGYVEKRFVRNPDSGIAHVALLPEIHPRNLQESISEENACEGFFEMTLASRPPSNEDIHDPDVSLPSGRTDWNIDSLEKIMPFFPGVSLDVNLREGNAICSQDLALGIPTHFQNDGSVLYMLTYALSPPTLNTVYDWLPVGKQHCVLDIVASKEGIDSYIDGVLNDGASCGQNSPPPTIVNWSLDELSQWNEENCPSEVENVHRCVSSEIKLDSLPAKEKVITNDFCNLSQISGPEKYQNSILTPLSQIGFRDPAYLGCGQQLTVISMELLAESRGDLRPDPKLDAINALSLVVQEDTSNISQIYVLLRVIDDKPVEKNSNGIFDCKLFHFTEEKPLLEHFVEIISYHDPDIIMGWEIQGSSLGYLTERALCLGINLLKKISRTPFLEKKDETKDSRCTQFSDVLPEVAAAGVVLDGSVIEDEWGRNHASGLHVGGRIVLNIWRLMRSELKLNIYTVEAVTENVLRQKLPLFSYRMLNQWYSSGIGRARHKCIEYLIVRSMLNLKIMVQLDMINRTSELARVFGIDFFSVISRGSQYRVESMLLRLAHTQNFLAISPGHQQVASQPAMECLPLVMEPESGFYADPVVVLDFQSLYPSMIIAYNICYSTCLGKVIPSRDNVLGVSSYSPDVQILKDLGEKILPTPNGVMYAPPDVRKGVLPRLLEEILSTRIMVKQTMKKLTSAKLVLHRILNARQLALKLISNVTYGYTAASFSGRMPCAEIADSIVQCGRRTLETAISFVNQHENWKAKVIYGDTDSMFVLLKGRSKEDAFVIGNEIASAITAMNPEPVALRMEKVYQPCFLLTKKRYVGYSYESPVQEKPMFDAKGIETVRRDTCPAVAKILERSIRLFFESKNLSEVKSYLKRQWTRILSGKISFKDFVFAKEVRLGTYRASSLPPAAIVARKAMEVDPRAEPLYGERVPYVVVHGEPGSRLVDMVIDPFKLLDLNSPYRLNDLYYINKQIIPALQRVFGLIGADLNQWFFSIPRPTRSLLAKWFTHMSHSRSAHEDGHDYPMVSKKPQAKRSRIETYYSSKHCALCGDLIQSSDYFCVKCSKKESLLVATVVGRTSEKERQMQHLAEICRHCGGGDWVLECGVKCISLACSVFYERRKVQKELGVLSSFAAETGFYPPCDAELF